MARDEATPSALEQKLALLPAQPGCYLFKDKHGAVLYVGKAKSLRSRVRSYFQEGGSDARAFIPFYAGTPKTSRRWSPRPKRRRPSSKTA